MSEQSASGTDHIYVVRLPGFWKWTPEYEIAYELATGQKLDDGPPEDDEAEDRISIMHTRHTEYVLDLANDPEVVENAMVCMNRIYDCGHSAYGPPRLVPSSCPECQPVATDGGQSVDGTEQESLLDCAPVIDGHDVVEYHIPTEGIFGYHALCGERDTVGICKTNAPVEEWCPECLRKAISAFADGERPDTSNTETQHDGGEQ